MPEPIIPPQPVKTNKGTSADTGKSQTKSVDARTPALQSTEGKTEIDEQSKFECELLGYRALGKIARQIAEEFGDITPDSKTRVILMDPSMRLAFEAHQSLLLQLSVIRDGYERASKLLEPPTAESGLEGVLESAAIGIGSLVANATGIVSALAGFLTFFREDVINKARPLLLNESALRADLASAMLAIGDIEVIDPLIMLYNPSREEQASHHVLKSRFQDVLDQRATAQSRLKKLASEIAELNFRIAPPDPDEPPAKETLEALLADLTAKRGRYDGAKAVLDSAEQQWAAIERYMSDRTPAIATWMTGFQQAEELIHLVREGTRRTFFLLVKIEASGGSIRIRRNLWRTLLSGDGLSFSGGAVVSYTFLDNSGSVVHSGTHRWLQPHVRFQSYAIDKADTNSF